VIRFNAGEWEGIDGMGEDMLRELRPVAEKAMTAGGIRFRSELRKTLTGTRTGREYKVSKTGALHVASAPGEAPAVLFGNLRNSMGFTEPKWEGWTLAMEVGSGLGIGSDVGDPEAAVANAYARRLEYGGEDSRGVKIAARPYMGPTELRMEPILDALFRGAF